MNAFQMIRRNAEFTQKLEEFELRVKKELAGYLNTHKLLSNASKIEKFLKIASAEQKRRFLQLLKCEWDPI
ncbi:MAG: hypothetical protein A4S09_15665 [Proteobacteria bacterium SG_bin7]|nr:MAG: hypothetical protein A4S09_15665 [Proteobacteria bacterium SG_bin7]